MKPSEAKWKGKKKNWALLHCLQWNMHILRNTLLLHQAITWGIVFKQKIFIRFSFFHFFFGIISASIFYLISLANQLRWIYSFCCHFPALWVWRVRDFLVGTLWGKSADIRVKIKNNQKMLKSIMCFLGFQ